MKKEIVSLSNKLFVGLAIRTNNKNEMDPATAKIGTLASRYWGEQLGNQLKHRTDHGVTYAIYTEFESDENGEYTYFIGEEVDSHQDQDLKLFKPLTVPASAYQKFTTPAGKMPDVLISAWQNIWKMKKEDFGGKRKYIAELEVYDYRASDPKNTVIDIYIGIEPEMAV